PNLDLMPTAPRQAPPLGPAPAPYPMPPPGAYPPGRPLPARQGPPPQAFAGRKKPSVIRPWMVIAAILILAGMVAILVAMSGPDVPVVQGK
ncbi:MAG TPA: hypothetical protein VN253_08515, partial [Kofleriaceae bacterium]|nr:hypothetical protein [Kofleriaceae bacterium]